MKHTFYPELRYPVADLSAFSQAIGLFVISLKSEEIIRFEPEDSERFKAWLQKYNVRDVDQEDS